MLTSLSLEYGSCDVLEIFSCLWREAVEKLKLMIVHPQLINGKIGVPNNACMSSERIWNVFFSFIVCCIRLCTFLWFLFNFIGFSSLGNTRLQLIRNPKLRKTSQVSVFFSLCLNFKLYAVFNKKDNEMNSFFLGQQDKINIGDFPFKP